MKKMLFSFLCVMGVQVFEGSQQQSIQNSRTLSMVTRLGLEREVINSKNELKWAGYNRAIETMAGGLLGSLGGLLAVGCTSSLKPIPCLAVVGAALACGHHVMYCKMEKDRIAELEKMLEKNKNDQD